MSDEDVVFVTCTSDSGPFSMYYKSHDQRAKIGEFETNTVPIPREDWDRYEAAERELHAAEEKLRKAEQAYLDMGTA